MGSKVVYVFCRNHHNNHGSIHFYVSPTCCDSQLYSFITHGKHVLVYWLIVDILLLVSILVILKIVLYVGDALDQIKGTKFVVERSFKNLKEDMGKEMEQVKNRTVSTVQSITVNVSSLRKLIVDLAMSNVEQRNIEIDRRVLKRMKDLGLEVCDVV